MGRAQEGRTEVTAISNIRAADVNLSAIMEREGIYQVRRYLEGRFTVQLHDGRSGIGGSVGEALSNAKRRAAA